MTPFRYWLGWVLVASVTIVVMRVVLVNPLLQAARQILERLR